MLQSYENTSQKFKLISDQSTGQGRLSDRGDPYCILLAEFEQNHGAHPVPI